MTARQEPSPLAAAGLVEALAAFGIAGAAATEIGADLSRRYRERWRRYHTLSHVDAMFALADRHRRRVADPTAVALAIWYHDAVYRPRRTDNEAASAALLRRHCGGPSPSLAAATPRTDAPRSPVDAAHELILATRLHLPPPTAVDGPLFLDFDLAILGSPADQYQRYAEAIRAEFRWVPGVIYRAKRIEALEGFLAREVIYRTEPFLDREETARGNLAAEIAALRG